MNSSTATLPTCDLEIIGTFGPRFEEILTPEALRFVGELHAQFATARHELLAERMKHRARFNNGYNLSFLTDTEHIRQNPTWQVASVAPGLEDRRVEITGPTDRKMTINALNSGANGWLADLEDANTPHWRNVVSGQVNLYDAVRKTIELTTEKKHYKLRDDIEHATIVVRPRGW